MYIYIYICIGARAGPSQPEPAGALFFQKYGKQIVNNFVKHTLQHTCCTPSCKNNDDEEDHNVFNVGVARNRRNTLDQNLSQSQPAVGSHRSERA